jgi:small-conductance mechanosensitive channel
VQRALRAAHWPSRWPTKWPVGGLAAAAVLLITLIAGWIVVHLLTRWVRSLTKHTETDLDDKILEIAERPVRRLVYVAGFYWATSELPLGVGGHTIATGLLFTVAVFISLRAATKIIIVLLLRYGANMDDEGNREHFEREYMPLLTKVIGTVVFTVGLISVLHHFGQNVSSLVAALGVTGVAISFASAQMLGNMLAGFAILVDRPFRPGDRIRLASGEIGDVIEVGTRSTRLKLTDQNMLIVPNNELVNQRVVNFNYPTHSTRAALQVSVAFGTDVERAKEIVFQIIKTQPEVVEPAPSVELVSIGGAALGIAGNYTISSFADAGKVQDKVRVAVYKAFQEAEIKVA